MNEQYASIIMGFPLFQGFTIHGAQMILECGSIKQYQPGDLVFTEGEPSSFTLLILTGKLKAFLKRPEGEVTLNDLTPGTIVGELGVLCGLSRSASVRAGETSVVLLWEAPDFRRLLLRNNLMSDRIMGQSLKTLISKERALLDSISQTAAGTGSAG
jgi:CRP-like cAMP-binding protein